MNTKLGKIVEKEKSGPKDSRSFLKPVLQVSQTKQEELLSRSHTTLEGQAF